MSLVRKLNASNCTEIKLCIFSVLKKAFVVIIQNKSHQKETFWELWTSPTKGNSQLMVNHLIFGKVHNIHKTNISLQKMLNKFQEDLPLDHWSGITWWIVSTLTKSTQVYLSFQLIVKKHAMEYSLQKVVINWPHNELYDKLTKLKFYLFKF